MPDPDPFVIGAALAAQPQLVAVSRGPSDEWARERLTSPAPALAELELTSTGFVARTWVDLRFLEGEGNG